MSQPPPPMGYPNQPPMPPYMPPQPPKNNGWAIGSLICGVLGCFPIFITGLLAIIFGVLGIKKSKEPQMGGKGMAIAGLILGTLGILWSGGFIGGTMWAYHKAQTLILEPSRTATRGFMNSLASGDLETARSYTTGALSQTDLSTLAQQVKSYGEFKEFKFKGVNATPSGQTMNFKINGTADFANISKDLSITLTGDPKSNTGFKISDLAFE